MSQNKITLKIAVRPLKGDSWKATCNAYPSIVGEGGDCDEALNSIVDKINEEFKSGTFKLDSGLKPAVSCKITEMKAVVTLGTENYTLSDFAAAPAADQEEAAALTASEFTLPSVPDISLQAGCDICKKYASGDCGGNSSNTSCGDFKPFRYAGEHCGTCASFYDYVHCKQYDATTNAEHNACTSYRPKAPEAAQETAQEEAA